MHSVWARLEYCYPFLPEISQAVVLEQGVAKKPVLTPIDRQTEHTHVKDFNGGILFPMADSE